MKGNVFPRPLPAIRLPFLLAHDQELQRALQHCLDASAREQESRWGGQPEPPAHTVRFLHFLRLVLAATRKILPDTGSRVSFLLYHRDWLVRHLVLRARLGPTKLREILDRFAREAQGWPTEGLMTLRHCFTASEAEPSTEIQTSELSDWLDALRRMVDLARLVPIRADLFADSAVEPLLLKALDGAANQAGIRPLDQGFAVHILLLALDADSQLLRTCQLLPPPLSFCEITEDADREVFDFEKLYDWQALTKATGEEGQLWIHRFRDLCRRPTMQIGEAITLLRQKKIEEGEALLAEAMADLGRLRSTEPTCCDVVSRFYFGAISYLAYCRNDLGEALAALDRAADAVRSAVGRSPFLIAFAAVALDIPLKKARLARDLGNWPEMVAWFRDHFEMLSCHKPILEMQNGHPLYWHDITERFAWLPTEDPVLGPALRFLRDPESRRRYSLHLAGSLCRQPHLVLD